MPYTKEQLQNGKSVFYNSIREDLRNNYLDVLSGSAENDFRDSDGVLISFERIDVNCLLISDIFKENLSEKIINKRLTRNMPACIIYTSGTSGNPKGVILSHGGILANCEGAYDLLLPLIKLSKLKLGLSLL